MNRNTTTRHAHYFCSMPGGDPDCIRGWEHSGECRPGCRICTIDTHLTLDCPTGHTSHDYTPEPDDMAMYEAEGELPPEPLKRPRKIRAAAPPSTVLAVGHAPADHPLAADPSERCGNITDCILRGPHRGYFCRRGCIRCQTPEHLDATCPNNTQGA